MTAAAETNPEGRPRSVPTRYPSGWARRSVRPEVWSCRRAPASDPGSRPATRTGTWPVKTQAKLLPAKGKASDRSSHRRRRGGSRRERPRTGWRPGASGWSMGSPGHPSRGSMNAPNVSGPRRAPARRGPVAELDPLTRSTGGVNGDPRDRSSPDRPEPPGARRLMFSCRRPERPAWLAGERESTTLPSRPCPPSGLYWRQVVDVLAWPLRRRMHRSCFGDLDGIFGSFHERLL
jgi:hypothetical protein